MTNLLTCLIVLGTLTLLTLSSPVPHRHSQGRYVPHRQVSRGSRGHGHVTGIPHGHGHAVGSPHEHRHVAAVSRGHGHVTGGSHGHGHVTGGSHGHGHTHGVPERNLGFSHGGLTRGYQVGNIIPIYSSDPLLHGGFTRQNPGFVSNQAALYSLLGGFPSFYPGFNQFWGFPGSYQGFNPLYGFPGGFQYVSPQSSVQGLIMDPYANSGGHEDPHNHGHDPLSSQQNLPREHLHCDELKENCVKHKHGEGESGAPHTHKKFIETKPKK